MKRSLWLLTALAVCAGCGGNGGKPAEVRGEDGGLQADGRRPADTATPADALEVLEAGPTDGGRVGDGMVEAANPDQVEATDQPDGGIDGWVYDYTPPDCPPGQQWQPGVAIFKEVTEAWGVTGVVGTRLSVVDFDDDGWPDLLVRNGGGPEDFAPGGSRSRWLLRNVEGKELVDVTEQSQLFVPRNPEMANGSRPGDVMAAGDVDNDGDLDIFVATAVHEPTDGHESCELMLNDGTGIFTLGPADSEARRAGKKSVPAGVTFTDYDRDGNLDLWMVHNMVAGANSPLPDALYRGDGSGRFEEVSKQLGIQTMGWMFPFQLNAGLGHSWGWSSAACDLNNDGIPELLAGSYGRCPNLLWQGRQGPGDELLYDNRSVASGYAYDHRMDWSDNESARCFCKLHPDAEDCAGVPPPQYFACNSDADIFRWNHESDREPWRLGGNSAATRCVDIDNDGFVDLLTGEIVHWDVGSSSDPAELLFNTGESEVRFVRPGNAVTGIVREHPGPVWDDGDMTNAVLDFDNDGLLDLYIGSSDYPHTRGLLFHQTSHRQFQPVATADSFEHLRSHGVVVVDLDRDGDLDMVVGHSRFRCGGEYLDDCYPTQQIRIFENILGRDNGNWLAVRLAGVDGTNRAAIGARVTLSFGCHRLLRDVDGAHGHFNTQDDLTLHFGVGQATEVEVEIRWPDKALSVQKATLATNRGYSIEQWEAPKVIFE